DGTAVVPPPFSLRVAPVTPEEKGPRTAVAASGPRCSRRGGRVPLKGPRSAYIILESQLKGRHHELSGPPLAACQAAPENREEAPARAPAVARFLSGAGGPRGSHPPGHAACAPGEQPTDLVRPPANPGGDHGRRDQPVGVHRPGQSQQDGGR